MSSTTDLQVNENSRRLAELEGMVKNLDIVVNKDFQTIKHLQSCIESQRHSIEMLRQMVCDKGE